MYKINLITMGIVSSLLLHILSAHAETFDTHFLHGGLKGTKTSDLALDGDKPMSGAYDLDIYLNNEWRGRYSLVVTEDPAKTCLPVFQIQQIGIKTDAFKNLKSDDCLVLNEAVQGGSVDYDISQLALKLTVPQAWVSAHERGYMPPETWDRGINALYTSYYASQYYSDYRQNGTSKNSYANFNSGLNLLGYQLHSSTNYTKSDDNRGKWKSNTLYLERGIPELMSTARAGDMYTDGELFDSVRFKGVRLWRDMQMLPNSKQNFTPVVRGIAQSNALVTIEQNGFVVYQSDVPPGPFAIDDLQLAGGGADLDVTVKEADGSTTHYLVPYSSVPKMLQPGVVKYDIAAGRSHIEGASNQADFMQGSWQYGVNNLITLYTGTMLADDYNAFLLGSGWNTPLGAFSLDVTRSHSSQDDGATYDGQSYQVTWSKYLSPTGTQLSMAAWRYSSKDYRTFNDHVWANSKNSYHRDENDFYDIADYYQNDFGRKNSVSLAINQALPAGWGSLSGSALWRDYWQRGGTRNDLQLSYSNNWSRVTYTLSASQSYDEDDREDKRFNIYFSIPFSWGDDIATPRRDLYISNSTTFDDDGYQQNNTNINGIVGDKDQFNYGVNLSHQRQDNETAAGANLTWHAPFATLDGSYSQSNRYNQASGSIHGGVVAWGGGINLTNSLSDTFAIIDAPGMEGISVQGNKYNTTSRQGKAIYSNLTPYRENTLLLDTTHADSDVALNGNRKAVVPYRGAVVLAKFDTDERKPWFFRAKRPDGTPLTFGHEVEDETGHNVGVVAQGSQLFIRTNNVPQRVRVATDKQQGLSCTITFGKTIDESKIYICR
ncbi:putative outer membrane usher protein YehB [Pseudescherichia vulneris NBRC 102420]|uniref:Putative outer membrane usher protein YehB n=1 Tax=Pseudescherichia vulneris NBRC 102420 TaxID=1115515 RepID=A0A090V1G7_PSEVU|nr:fimbrial biogenesis outer membrane usher protein [Pseudescherichia vulneris]GAL58656.1 putative outer membrane usher protein YehB [Pseudescherichia vulneris NBRC 102420]